MRRGAYRFLLAIGAVVMVAAAMLVAKASAATQSSPVQITSATLNADRTLSVSWDVPVGTYGGVLVVVPSSTTDFTGAMPFDVGTIGYDLLSSGWTNYKTLPLDMTIQQPTTIYVQVQLIDPYGDGTCQQGDGLVDCDSQVVALTVNPICSPVTVTDGYYSTDLVKASDYTKQLVHRGHWLRRYGHYVRRNGHRVWVKAVYRRIYHPAVSQQVWHPPVTATQCH
jgi:hypothetical protein